MIPLSAARRAVFLESQIVLVAITKGSDLSGAAVVLAVFHE
jgi:hypothetical protein